MKKKMLLLLPILCFVVLSCSAHVHTVGDGPRTGQTETAAQWWILFGLVPLNQVDTDAMAEGADDYEIKTSMEPMDILIGIPAGYITVSRRTVTVTK